MRADERALQCPGKSVLVAIWPRRRVDAEPLKTVLPAAAIAAKAAQHDDLAADFAQERDPVLQEPHIPTAGSVHDLVVYALREVRQRSRGEIFLLDGHDDSFAACLWGRKEVVYGAENLLEGRAFWEDAVVGYEVAIDDRQSNIQNADARLELDCERCG